jgi:hypothetical protein
LKVPHLDLRRNSSLEMIELGIRKILAVMRICTSSSNVMI